MNNTKHIISKVTPATILLVAAFPVLIHTKLSLLPLVMTFVNTTFLWVVSGLVLIVFLMSKYFFYDKRNDVNLRFVTIYLIWNVICIIRGMFVAEIYWDWKAIIGNTMALMLPVVIYSSTNKLIAQSILAYYIKYALPLFIVFAILLRTDAYGFYLNPISLLIIFMPTLTTRQRIIIFIFTGIVMGADLGARSNVLKFGVPFAILSIYYFRKIIPHKLLETLRILLFVIPIVLFVLGATGVFNIFKIQDYLKSDITSSGVGLDGQRTEISITQDTRTFLYEEVINSAVKNNYVIWGRTPARGNDSLTFGIVEHRWTGRYERLANEIGLANVFTWTGIIGVILYSLLFFKASNLAVNKSNNSYSKMLGIFIAFRWFYSWIEDVNDFSLNYFILMITLGLCFSNSFREMTNMEVTHWARGIFDVRYIKEQRKFYSKKQHEAATRSNTINLPQQEA